MAAFRVIVTEHDGNVETKIYIPSMIKAQCLRTRLQHELESQITITEPELVTEIPWRCANEFNRAIAFIAMVM